MHTDIRFGQPADLAVGFRALSLRAIGGLCRVLPIGRTTVFKSFWRSLGSPRRFIASLDGSPYVVDVTDSCTALRQFLFQCYEPEVTAVFVWLLSPGSHVVDVGANKGYFSLIAARRVGAAGRVTSYEPSPENLLDLYATRDLCDYPNWEIVPKAVSGQRGKVRFRCGYQAGGEPGWGAIASDGDIEVDATTIDDELAFRSRHVDVLKMDIEGHESDAFRGMRRSLSEHRIRHLLVELHPWAYPRNFLFSMERDLRAFGYRGQTTVAGHATRRQVRRYSRCSRAELDMVIPLLLGPFDVRSVPTDRTVHVLWSLT